MGKPVSRRTLKSDLAKVDAWVVPSKELVIVRTGNSDPDWDEAQLPNLLIRGMAQ